MSPFHYSILKVFTEPMTTYAFAKKTERRWSNGMKLLRTLEKRGYVSKITEQVHSKPRHTWFLTAQGIAERIKYERTQNNTLGVYRHGSSS